MKKLHKMMKAFAVSVALALVFCMIPVGSAYAEEAGKQESTGDELGNESTGVKPGENNGTTTPGEWNKGKSYD